VDEKTNHGRSQDNIKKPDGRRNHYIGRNMMKWNKRTESTQETRKKRWTSMGREWTCLYGWENIHTKQPEDQRKDTSRKP